MGCESGRQVRSASEDEAMNDCVDEKLAAALYDVPVPEGLAQRLLERLATAENEAKSIKPRPVGFAVTTGRGFCRRDC